MHSPGALGVVDIHAAREKLRRQPRTVIVQASNVRPDAEVHRHIGINDALHLNDLQEVLSTCFGLGRPFYRVPCHFSTTSQPQQRLDLHDEIHNYLQFEGDELLYHWGLWEITLRAVESYPRDAGTPRALCVGGSGAFGDAAFDLAGINAALTGTDTINDVLTSTRREVTKLIQRSGIFDYVPLLQALDLDRGVNLPPATHRLLASLPCEEDQYARDSFWSVVLALACMGDEELSEHIIATTLDSLGYNLDNAESSPRSACVESLVALASVGGYGPDSLSPVDRLDIYRALLRAR